MVGCIECCETITFVLSIDLSGQVTVIGTKKYDKNEQQQKLGVVFKLLALA